MNEPVNVCLTFEAACLAAIEMENGIFQDFVRALRVVKDQAARDILLEAALAKLAHKYNLEMAALEGKLDEPVSPGPVSIMHLAVRCGDQHQIDANADNRKALAFSIRMAQDALRFYRDMSKHCAGAPMAQIFTVLGDEQTRQLQHLEDTYEAHFLTEG